MQGGGKPLGVWTEARATHYTGGVVGGREAEAVGEY